MPHTKILFRPGINRQRTQTQNMGGWSDASLVRFRDGLPQTWYGWQSVVTTVLDAVCRGIWTWQNLSGVANIAFGTTRRIQILQGGVVNDVTPIDTSGAAGTLVNNPFLSGTIGTPTVTVHHAAHGRNPGDVVQFKDATVFDGITLTPTASVFSEYIVQTAADADHYTITAPQNATAGATNGGGAVVAWQYYMPSGPTDAIFGNGWGAGPWGGVGSGPSGALGNNPFATTNTSATVVVTHASHGRGVGARVDFAGAVLFNNVTMNGSYTVLNSPAPTTNTYAVTAGTVANATSSGGGAAVTYNYFGPGWGVGATTTIKSQSPRIVTFDNWGQDLVFNPRGLGIYNWIAANGVGSRAVILTANDAPTQCNAILIGIPERHLIAYGANNPLTGLAFDPLNIRWSDVETYNVNGNWTATATNTAGSFRLQGGTKIMYAKRTQNGILVLTDDVCYLQAFIGYPLVYSFRPQGAGAGLIAVNAIVEANGTVEWMGPNGFYSWRGAIRKLESTLHNDVFGSGSVGLNRDQQEKVFAGFNSTNNEITYFYPSNYGNGECDRYIAHNIAEDLWYGGALPRSCWIDRSIFPNPIAVDPSTGAIYFHEIGVDADGTAMAAYIESGYVDLSDGDAILYIDRIIPDFADFTGSVTITFKGQQYPNGPVTTKGPYTVTPSTKFIRSPIRARQVAIRISSSTIGDWWRLGALRVQSQPDGKVY